MSSRELNRVEVMGRVGSGDLKLTTAAILLELSLSAGEKIVAAISAGGQEGVEAWQCRSALESQ